MEDNKQDLGRIIKIAEENTKGGPIIIFLFFVLCGFGFGTIFVLKANIWAGLICMLATILVAARLFYIVVFCVRFKRLANYLKNDKALIKKIQIDKFKSSSSGYCLVASESGEKYEADLEGAQSYLHGWCSVDIIDKNYCEEKGVPYSPNDPNYDEDAINRKIKNIWGRIELLEKQLKDANLSDKSEIKEQLWKLNDEMKIMVPPYVIYKNRRLYIGDELTVYVDPNNYKNYIIDI